MTFITRDARPSPDTSIDWCDPIPTRVATLRKLITLATVVRINRSGPNTLDELDATAQLLAEAAFAAPSLHRKVLNLWKIEGLVFRFFEHHDDPELSLGRSSMPLAGGPPAHCGLAMAVILREGFDPRRLEERFAVAADPRFARFCYETTGLMLAIAERDLLGGLMRIMGPLGLLRQRLPAAPEMRDFLASFSEENRRLAAHGFGRALYFKTVGYSKAVSRIVTETDLPTTAALRGLGSANSLINCRDLHLLLAQDTGGLPPSVAEGLDGGLFNSLCLLEWTFPGCLASLDRTDDRGKQTIAAAAASARSARDNGAGPPMEA